MTANPVSPDSSRRHSAAGAESTKRLKLEPTVVDWVVVIERFKADMKRRYR